MLAVAILGIVVNLAATWVLAKANRESLNVEGSYQHILTDLAAFVFTAIAGLVILMTGFDQADGIASLIDRGDHAQRLLRAPARVRAASSSRRRPRGLDPDEIGGAMAAIPGSTRSTTCTSGR